MATDNCSVIVMYSSEDGVQWSNYLVNLLTQVELDVTSVGLDSSGTLSLSGSRCRRGGAVIVLLASPGFLKSLLADRSDSLDAVVNNTELVVLFLCGPLMHDLEETDCRGRRLSDRFPGLDGWTTLTHEDLKQLPRTVCDLLGQAERRAAATAAMKSALTSKKSLRPRDAQNTSTTTAASKKQPKMRPKTSFKLVPDKVRCEVRYGPCSTTNDFLQQARVVGRCIAVTT